MHIYNIIALAKEYAEFCREHSTEENHHAAEELVQELHETAEDKRDFPDVNRDTLVQMFAAMVDFTDYNAISRE